MTKVYVRYQRPRYSRDGKKLFAGLIEHVVGDRVVADSEWPYPFEHLPVALFHVDDIDDTWLGHTFVTDARHPQASLNYFLSQQAEAAMTMVPKLLMPSSADSDMWDDDPRSFFVYEDDGAGGGAKPEWMYPQSGA